jgi:hypothetical protein
MHIRASIILGSELVVKNRHPADVASALLVMPRRATVFVFPQVTLEARVRRRRSHPQNVDILERSSQNSFFAHLFAALELHLQLLLQSASGAIQEEGQTRPKQSGTHKQSQTHTHTHTSIAGAGALRVAPSSNLGDMAADEYFSFKRSCGLVSSLSGLSMDFVEAFNARSRNFFSWISAFNFSSLSFVLSDCSCKKQPCSLLISSFVGSGAY